jgi:hypothetical protein
MEGNIEITVTMTQDVYEKYLFWLECGMKTVKPLTEEQKKRASQKQKELRLKKKLEDPDTLRQQENEYHRKYREKHREDYNSYSRQYALEHRS